MPTTITIPTPTPTSAPRYNAACQTLAEASQRIGADPLLIQAAGGNSSIKEDDTLWVKASGLWLRDALQRPMFVPVALSQVRERVRSGDDDPVGPAVLQSLAIAGLRPSIETTLHALMPHRVVLHVHAIDAIVWAVLPDAQATLTKRLAGLNWGWVEYRRPGLPLTHAVAELTQRQVVDVVLMANHGMVIGADTVPQAEALLQHVVDRLRLAVRRAPRADSAGLARDAEGTGWQLPVHPDSHGVATDPLNLRRAERGVLYPDHVVFLGHRVATAPTHLTGDGALRAWLVQQRSLATPPPYVAVPGRGVLVRDDLPEAAQEMLACLAHVLERLPECPEPVYLPDEETRALANWEAEKFRQLQQR